MSRASHVAVTVVAFALLAVVIHGEPVWVSFDDTPEPVPPTVEIVSGDANQVIYSIQVHGMLVSDTVVEGEVYRRLELPGEGVLSDEGLPELRNFRGHSKGFSLLQPVICVSMAPWDPASAASVYGPESAPD